MKKTIFVIFLAITLLASVSYSQDKSQPFNYPLEKVWKFTLEGREATGYNTGIYTTPLFDNLKIYLASTNGTVTAIYKRDRQVSWQFLTSYPIRREMLLRSDFIIVSAGKDVFSLDKNTGAVNWVFTADFNITSGLSGDDELVLFADELGNVYSVENSEGKIRWRFQNSGGKKITSEMFVYAGYLFYGDETGKVFSINIKEGKKTWQFQAGAAVRSGFAEYNGILYFGSDDNYIYALTRTGGSQKWRQRTAGDVRGYPAVYGDYLFISSRDRSIRAVRKVSGSFSDLGDIKLSKGTDIKPMLIDETMIYPQGAEITCMGPFNNFRVFGKLALEADITSPPAFDDVDKLLYLGLRDGSLQAVTSSNQLEAKRMIREETLKVSQPEESSPLKVADPGNRQKKRQNKKSQKKNDSTPEENENSGEKPATKKSINLKNNIVDEETDRAAVKQTIESKEIDEPEEGQNLQDDAELELENANYTRAAYLYRHLLKDKAETHYTVSLGLFCQEKSLENLLTKLEKSNRYLFARQHQDKVCFFVCSGLYESKASAEQALIELKERLGIEEGVKSYRLDSFIN